jgi:hypothetical protein
LEVVQSLLRVLLAFMVSLVFDWNSFIYLF